MASPSSRRPAAHSAKIWSLQSLMATASSSRSSSGARRPFVGEQALVDRSRRSRSATPCCPQLLQRPPGRPCQTAPPSTRARQAVMFCQFAAQSRSYRAASTCCCSASTAASLRRRSVARLPSTRRRQRADDRRGRRSARGSACGWTGRGTSAAATGGVGEPGRWSLGVPFLCTGASVAEARRRRRRRSRAGGGTGVTAVATRSQALRSRTSQSRRVSDVDVPQIARLTVLRLSTSRAGYRSGDRPEECDEGGNRRSGRHPLVGAAISQLSR